MAVKRKVCAIIAEYNPFHNGHAYQLQKARELVGADQVAVLMSGCFTQRGEPTLFSPTARAEMALRCGADMVFTSPPTVSVREGDTYALHNIMLLNKIRFITHLAFGAECGDLEMLQKVAQILETPDEKLDNKVTEYLNTRVCSHAQALSDALYDLYQIPPEVTSAPNNILAICYLRALIVTKSRLIPVVIKRQKSYHAQEVYRDFPSATSLRIAIQQGNWQAVKRAVPPEAYKIMQRAAQNGEVSRSERLDTLLRYRLSTITREEFWALPDVYEGIENFIFKNYNGTMTREEILSCVSTRRYSRARVSRLLCHALLHTTIEIWEADPKHLHLIGFTTRAASLAKQLNRFRIQDADRKKTFAIGDQIRLDRRADAIWYNTTNGQGGFSQLRKTLLL